MEPYHWDCDDQGLFYYGDELNKSSRSAAHGYWKVYTSPINPFIPRGWIGTCQFPQITSGGLQDSWQHGADLYGVYHDLLGFLPSRDDSPSPSWRDKVRYRVTNNVITSQVAGMVIAGMWNTTQPAPLQIQASTVDSLEPRYSCPASKDLFSRIQANERWTSHLTAASPLYAELDAISGVPPDDEGFHESLDHYYDNLSARQCHAKPFPCNITSPDKCVNQSQADSVYRLGHYEYSHIYRDSGPETLAASVASYGVWIAELAAHLRAVSESEKEGSGDYEGPIWFHNVAHDGSVSRLLSVLQMDEMVWPGMGSEVVFEVYKGKGSNEGKEVGKESSMPKMEKGDRRGGTAAEGESGTGYFVRVLFSGKVFKSSNPSLGKMDLLPLETLLAYFDGLVGKDASLVKEKCAG